MPSSEALLSNPLLINHSAMSSSSSSDSKVVLVIGATGAQGLPVVRALLAPSSDGKASPWKVRALTRDPTHRRAKELESLGVELYQGMLTFSLCIYE